MTIGLSESDNFKFIELNKSDIPTMATIFLLICELHI